MLMGKKSMRGCGGRGGLNSEVWKFLTVFHLEMRLKNDVKYTAGGGGVVINFR